MHRLLLSSIIIFGSLFLAPVVWAENVNSIVLNEPVSVPFIANEGQYQESVRYVADLMPGTVVVGGNDIAYSFPSSSGFTEAPLKGMFNPTSVDLASTTVNYFIGNDADKWKTDVSTYNSISLGEVFKGITVDLKAKPNTVEKIFTVAPGSKPSAIAFSVSSNVSLKVTKEGVLAIKSINKKEPVSFTFSKPVAYQIIDGKRIDVSVKYALRGKRTYGFMVGTYDKTVPLIIDPELDSVVASTFLGGNGSDTGPRGYVASDGSIYFAGMTASTNLPTTTGVYGPNLVGTAAVFVAKMSDTAHLTALTYIGSAGQSSNAALIATDSSGNVVVIGSTTGNFPTTPGAFQTSPNSNTEVFITKFTSDLTSLVASTLYGSGSPDSPSNFKIDSTGNIYVYGRTGNAVDLPMAGSPYSSSYAGGGATVSFIAKFNSSLTSLVASTFVQGNNSTFGNDLLVDNTGKIWVTGQTAATNFPTTTGVFQGIKDTNASYDAYISVFNDSLSSLVKSTLLGGNGDDIGDSLALDRDGNVLVFGTTASGNFPNTTTTDGYQKVYAGGSTDFFVAKLNSDLSNVVAATYLGGSSATSEFLSVSTRGSNLALIEYPSSYEVVVFGETASTSTFPTTTNAYQTAGRGGTNATIISKLSSDLKNLRGSTLFNGAGSMNGGSFVANRNGLVYVFGYASNSNLIPVINAYQSSIVSSFDTSLTLFVSTPVISNVSPSSATAGDSDVIITITGSAFAPSSTVQFNGAVLNTVTVNSSTNITAVVPSALITTYGTSSITVSSAAYATSSAASFVVNNPSPSLVSLSTANIQQTNSATSITLTGSGFVTSSQVVFNGTTLSTSYLSSASLNATIPENTLTTPGDYAVLVRNSAPGGGTSGSITLTVTPLSVAATPPLPPVPPSDGKGFSINTNAQTNNSNITVTNHFGSDTVRMAYAINDPNFTNSSQVIASPQATVDLCQGKTTCLAGNYILYARFYTDRGVSSPVVSAVVTYVAPTPNTNNQSQENSECSAPTIKRTLKVGSVGMDVKNLQIYLNCAGFIVAKSGFGSVGKETTAFGSATKAALIRWQKINVAPLRKSYKSGELDLLTRQVMNRVK